MIDRIHETHKSSDLRLHTCACTVLKSAVYPGSYLWLSTVREKTNIGQIPGAESENLDKWQSDWLTDRQTEREREAEKVTKQQDEDNGSMPKSVPFSVHTLAPCFPDILKIPWTDTRAFILTQLMKRNTCVKWWDLPLLNPTGANPHTYNVHLLIKTSNADFFFSPAVWYHVHLRFYYR